jgi:baseplate J-like protein
MTVTAAPPRRLVVDLDADATILDAARRLAAADPAQDVVVVVPAGAPLTRNAAFLDVLNRRAGGRRLVMVSSDARARSLASSVHLRAFASLAALERHELDATEHLSDARRVALATIAAVGGRGISVGRALAVFISLLMAAGILTAVVAPSATVVLAAKPSPLGPSEYDLRAGPNGDIKATSRTEPISAKTTVKPTGSRTDPFKAQGVERFTNLTTNDILIAKGTVVRTNDDIRFQTTEDKTLPRSTLLPFVISTVNISIQAVDPGPAGNVPPQKINVSPSTNYTVTNPVETLGGELRKILIVQQSDYDIAVAQSDLDLKAEADKQMKAWQSQAPKGSTVYGSFVKRTTVSPPGDVVGKEAKEGAMTFEIAVNGMATVYTVEDSQPKDTALSKLEKELPPGMELVPDSGVVDVVIPASVAEDGVHWRVRARGQQSTRPQRAQITAALAGRELRDVAKIAQDSGFELVGVTAWPAWWPRLPVLDSRITIKVESAVSSGSP